MTLQEKEFFSEIGCHNCGKGGNWKIFTNGKGNFEAKHLCGHVSKFEIKTQKAKIQAFDMRLFL